jgi:hypothetical protein
MTSGCLWQGSSLSCSNSDYKSCIDREITDKRSEYIRLRAN